MTLVQSPVRFGSGATVNSASARTRRNAAKTTARRRPTSPGELRPGAGYPPHGAGAPFPLYTLCAIDRLAVLPLLPFFKQAAASDTAPPVTGE